MTHVLGRAIERPHALRRALALLVALGVSYSLAILLLAIGGGTPGSAPWLPISRASYFYVGWCAFAGYQGVLADFIR